MEVVIYPVQPELRYNLRFWVWGKSRDEIELMVPVVYSLKLTECRDFTITGNAIQFSKEEHLLLFLLKYNPG